MPTHLREWLDPPHCVGRQRELAFLQSAVHDAALGSGSITLVAGAPGIGKSRLLRECVANATGCATIEAQCAMQPVRGHDLRAQLGSLPGLLRRKAVVVTVDDAHNAGATDSRALSALASMARRQRIALIIAFDEDEARYSAATERWLRPGERHMRLAPLDSTSMEILIHGLLHARGIRLGGDAMQEIVDTAYGNPRFAIELGSVTGAPELTGTLIPQSARTQIERLRARVPVESFDALIACSTLGERFDQTALAAILELPLPDIVGALERACEFGVLAEDPAAPGVFSFRHPALRKAVYFSTISAKRKMLHERVVRTFAKDARVDVDLAHQWIALERPARAASTLLQRGNERLDRRDFVGGFEAFRRAMDLARPGDKRWNSIARGFVECCDRLGRYAAIIPVVEAMRAFAGFSALPYSIRMLELLFYSYLNECDPDRARGIVDDLSRGDGEAERRRCNSARLLLAYAYAHAGRRHDAARLFKATDSAQSEDRELCYRYHVASAALYARSKPLPTVLAHIDAALDAAKPLGTGARVSAYDEATECALQHGNVREAFRLNDESMRAALSVNTVARLERDSAKCAALVHLAAGDVPAARTLVVKFLNWRDAGKYVEAFLAGIGVAVGVHAGDLAVVDAFFDSELLKRAVDNREAELCGFLLPGFSEILRARGMSDELTDALVACVANSIVDPYLSVQACVARYAPLETLDDVELQVARYLAESVTAIGPVHAAYVRAIVARRRGALARAKRFAVDAARGYEHFGWRLRQAQALEMAADYAAAETLFERCGATADARRAAAGVRRKNRRASFGARLTPREQEVARMIARGRSDRDVAHVLQISVRTVHHHVEAILSKLGVANRERIASALQNGATDRRLPR